MKITPRQAEARRANGKLSQGPKTAEGKAISSQNSLKFGFFALDPLLPGDSETEFAAFRMGWTESLRPADHAEQALVDRIADSAWRLRRFLAVEAGLYTAKRRTRKCTANCKRESSRSASNSTRRNTRWAGRFAGTRARAAASPASRVAR